ncbi:MAG TPA: glycosyltransferase family 2 protein [Clostridia bacterium]|nr:glycosyltransferase family 2 protein [Clostridia bacterium]
MDKISVVVPCYREEDALPHFWNALKKVMTEEFKDVEFEVLFVDDGSSDGTLGILKKLAEEDSRVRYISFSRNFGKESAMYAGLENSTGDYVVVMDADMQDPPELLSEMYRTVKHDGYDCAATRRVNRIGEPKIRSFCARLFYKLMRKITKIDIVDGARDYRLMSRQMVDAIISVGEYNRFSKGIFSWVGFNTKWLEYENVKRVDGETKWSFWKLLLYSFEGIVAFSTVPLAISSIIGIILCLVSFAAIVFVVIRQLVWHNSAYGWASMVSIILMLSGIQLFSIGILGQYLAKTYLEVKRRPLYIIKDSNIIRREHNEEN